MFQKLLVANRGEIAVRIMSSARRMGLETVAVYSQADSASLHVIEADEAYYIGPSPSVQSYLDVKNVMNAIHKSGADAVHPGYGFLSENAEFARALQKEGIAFIGPNPDAISKMGDKITSKKLAKEAGVNTIPGTLDAVTKLDDAKQIALEIGYPVMIKAAAGGGGKGMRIVRTEEELQDALRAASSEAGSSFSDDRVFIEKYIENPRHIEIQIVADKHGNVVFLGERECSIQRRHQKVIEEAPSPFIDDETRAEMGRQSVALARAANYDSVGTVEFVVDKNRNFYFLEMNTRLQVEHRVTELVTGLDLVELMIRIAAGEPLGFTQEEVQLNGWAIESRIYSEDPARGFLPSIGRVVSYREPEKRPGILIDSAIYEGSEISMFYDPMIAKLCTYGKTRAEAIELMKNALSEYHIKGVTHNIGFLEAILNNQRFEAGDMSTNFIADEYPGGFSGAVLDSESERVLMAVSLCIHLRELVREDTISGQMPGRSRPIASRWVVNIGGEDFYVFVTFRSNGYDIMCDSEVISIRSSWEPGRKLFQGVVNGRSVNVRFEHALEGYNMNYAGSKAKVIPRTPRVAELAKYMPEISDAAGFNELRSPIAGLLVGIRVKEGDDVKAGHPLVLIEAMKMENVIYADRDVKIGKILVSERESVAFEQVLIEFA
jgi:propionyl-CoA carboxylase alpha chain